MKRNPLIGLNVFANAGDLEHEAIMRKERTWAVRIDPKERARMLRILAKREARRKLKPPLKPAKYGVAKEEFIKRNASLGMTPARFEQLREKFIELTTTPEFREFVTSKRPGIELFVQTKLTQKVPTTITHPVTGIKEVRMISAVNVPTALIFPFITFAIHNVNKYKQLRSVEKKKKKLKVA